MHDDTRRGEGARYASVTRHVPDATAGRRSLCPAPHEDRMGRGSNPWREPHHARRHCRARLSLLALPPYFLGKEHRTQRAPRLARGILHGGASATSFSSGFVGRISVGRQLAGAPMRNRRPVPLAPGRSARPFGCSTPGRWWRAAPGPVKSLSSGIHHSGSSSSSVRKRASSSARAAASSRPSFPLVLSGIMRISMLAPIVARRAGVPMNDQRAAPPAPCTRPGGLARMRLNIRRVALLW
jgi:hypothetical protein